MGRPYAREMVKLAETFQWAVEADIQPLRQAVRSTSSSSLRAIGSGGALTAAVAMVGLHQRYTRMLGNFATPLEATDSTLAESVSTWLISAGGSNVDIMTAAASLIRSEPRHLGVICGRPNSPLAKLCQRHPYVNLLIYPPPSGKDGFLATNSLLGTVTLLLRAYAAAFESDSDWEDALTCARNLLDENNATIDAWQASTEPIWKRSTTLVLHGSSTRVGAIDLESKFTEAAIGNLQIADYRNFAHGRHHWLAKRGKSSGVLALITGADRRLAERTLDLIPTEIPQARIVLEGGQSAVALGSLFAAIRITGWAGIARGIDPGRPSVPNFGRRLYHLAPHSRRRLGKLPELTPREEAAITRKANAEVTQLRFQGDLHHWQAALSAFRSRLENTCFGGIVFDYDGTLVDTRTRDQPPKPAIITKLVRLAENGIRLGVATGRGASVRRVLQECLPRDIWHLVFIGYYNGAEVASLHENEVPDGSVGVCTELQPVVDALGRELALSQCDKDLRRFQVTIHAPPHMSVRGLWDLVQHATILSGTRGLRVTFSGHSVDLTLAEHSKLSVVSRLRDLVANQQILTIGDRGRWPGNDFELLGQPFALGVDEISMEPSTCWHLGAPGQRGESVTLEYLRALKLHDGQFKISANTLR